MGNNRIRKSVLGVVVVLIIVAVIVGGYFLLSGGNGGGEGGLDLREANVVDVEIEKLNGSYKFDVTLHYDDDGEDGYANRWRVETLGGEELGRRVLAHAHGTQEFTRSKNIEIPQEAKYVVVRGHDQNHGYGGQVMIVNLRTSQSEKISQGSEKQDFSDYS